MRFSTLLKLEISSFRRVERSIFQTFWKLHCCPIPLSFEIMTSNFGSSYVFLSSLKWRDRIWPNLTFWTKQRHISGAPKSMAVAKISCIYLKKKRFWNNGSCILPEIHAIWSYNERWDFPRAGSSLFLPRFSGLMFLRFLTPFFISSEIFTK